MKRFLIFVSILIAIPLTGHSHVESDYETGVSESFGCRGASDDRNYSGALVVIGYPKDKTFTLVMVARTYQIIRIHKNNFSADGILVKAPINQKGENLATQIQAEINFPSGTATVSLYYPRHRIQWPFESQGKKRGWETWTFDLDTCKTELGMQFQPSTFSY